MIKIDAAKVLIRFPHEINAEQITLFREPGMDVLLKQLTKEINDQIRELCNDKVIMTVEDRFNWDHGHRIFEGKVVWPKGIKVYEVEV